MAHDAEERILTVTRAQLREIHSALADYHSSNHHVSEETDWLHTCDCLYLLYLIEKEGI